MYFICSSSIQFGVTEINCSCWNVLGGMKICTWMEFSWFLDLLCTVMSLVLVKPFSWNSQSAGKLLDTGFNTVQSTLLLKKQVEVEKVQEDLDIKRQQFAERMAACKRKEEELKKKQTQVKRSCL